MKRLVINSLIALLTVCIIGLTAVGCGSSDGNNDNNDSVTVDKTALNAEIALEVSEQGDYTLDSYNRYSEKLREAKSVAEDAAATAEAVEKVLRELTEARLALAVRAVEEVKGAEKEFRMVIGSEKEILLADYININGLSKITYNVQANSDAISLSTVADGKFTVTAAEVNETTDAKISIAVFYDGTQKLSVELSVRITKDLAPIVYDEEFVKEYDVFALENKECVLLNFAENVDNAGDLALKYTVKRGEEELDLDGALYTFDLGSYTEEYTYESFTVTVTYTANGKEQSIEYVYKLGIKDTGEYRIANGNFENGLEGWILTNSLGEKPFGGIDGKTTFWGEGYPMNNVGNYFSSYAEGAEESSQGTLASPYFVVKGEYATYMLGGAGNPNVFITIENKDGEVLALYRNTEFADFPAGDLTLEEKREMIGNTVFLANFVTYKISLAEFVGQEIRFVINDRASSGWGVVFFDELNTYASADDVPENAILAENLLADKTALSAELALEIGEMGDYTADSYTAYTEKLLEAREILGDIAATAELVDRITEELTAARLALTVRPVEEVEGANKAIRLICGDSLDLLLSDYINTNGLSKITYDVKASNGFITLSAITDGKFTVTAGEVSESAESELTVTVYYDGTEKLSVDINVQIANFLIPTVYSEEITRIYDLYNLQNKENLLINFADNVENAGGIELTYSVTRGGEVLVLDGTSYLFVFDSYDDEATLEEFEVTVSYVVNGNVGSVSYTLTLSLYDTTSYRLANGGFEDGLDGWNKVGNIGDVSSDTHYWVEEWENGGKGYEFLMDGEYMFSAYAEGALESAVGTLTSSDFTVGGSGFVTFKIGAMKDGNYVYVDVVDADTKEILARYYNGLWADTTDGLKSGCTLIAYKADLSAFMGRDVFFRISDNADSGYGLFFADSFITYYAEEPQGFNTATPVEYEISGTIYDLFNGGFEMGDVQGWWNIGDAGAVTSADAFFSGVAYGKDGTYLYSGVEDFQGGNGREGNVGTLTSSVFELGGNGYITYMLGGGNAFCYVQVIDSTTGEVLARFRQTAREDAVLKTYVADLSEYIGRSVRIQLVDNATRDWGCVSFDNVVTYYDTIPEGIAAVDVKYEIVNGSFETGNLEGWNMSITEAGAHNTLGWVQNAEIEAEWYAKNDGTKDGDYLMSFVTPDNINCESSKGTLTSSVFTLKQNAFVSFRFGGAGNASNHDVFIELCKADGSVIATFFNDAEGKVNTAMNAYCYQYTGETSDCFFRVVDNSTSDYGCFVIDDFRVNLDTAPDGFIAAIQE